MNFLTGISNRSLDNLLQTSNEILGKGRREAKLGSFFLLKSFFKKDFIFRERGREGGEGEKHQCVVASCILPTGDLAHNPSMCPHWELNQ